MNRRQFLHIAGVGGASTIVCRSFAKGSAILNRRQPKVEEASISELQAAMTSGRFTAVNLTRSYLERIESLDRRGPALNSVIELNPDALPIARRLDHERKNQGPRGPLHGIPVLIKDNIATLDRMSTTAGSLALLGSRPGEESFVARRLREAGAVILGKTNLSEWANFRSSRSTSGWSARGGLTRNPYVLDRNPSGSSSGSGVAVAANLCAAAVGTETDGSILSPSSVNGIVGLKPTLGLISRLGIIPIAHSQDTAGPMARTVTDAAALLGTLTGVDSKDPATRGTAGKSHTDYTRFLAPDGLRGARVGVARRLFVGDPASDNIMEAALQLMRQSGAEIIDPADLPSHGKFGDAEMEVLLYEFKADLNAYLASLPPGPGPRMLQELIDFNNEHRDQEMPYFQQELFLQAESKGPLTETGYKEALALCRRLSRDEGIDAIMGAQRLDALVAPTTGPAHVTDLIHGDRDIGGSTSPAAVAGYPSITVPMGFVSDLPIGISFFGRAYSEPLLLKLAFAFEQATQVRQPPRFLPTLPARLAGRTS